MNFTHRFIARFTIEADTPLSVGSGEKGIAVDRLIAKDANGLPYIPGTALAGVLRHSFTNEEWINDIFGSGGSEGKGSRLIISSACLISEDGETAIEGLHNIDLTKGFYSYFSRLPERDHVRITHKGSADTDGHGKFDEELVHKGTRFVFEMELIGNKDDEVNWKKLLNVISSPAYRIGAGTRKGFGKLKIIEDKSFNRIYALNGGDLREYLSKTSSLNYAVDGTWEKIQHQNENEVLPGWKQYSINLKAKDFFLFGAGFGDEDADNKPKTEKFFEWDTGKPQLKESKNYLLIPATSIKGALAHRTAFHYNLLSGKAIENSGAISFKTKLNTENILQNVESNFNIESLVIDPESPDWEKLSAEIESIDLTDGGMWEDFLHDIDEEINEMSDGLPVGENNEAVKSIFGYAKNSEGKKEGLRGRLIIDDVYLPYNIENEKVFNHTKIDRFTNGTIDGALFQEKAYATENETIVLEIWVEERAFEGENGNLIEKSFEKTLKDLKTGRLPLGGNSAKGHGIFTETKNEHNERNQNK